MSFTPQEQEHEITLAKSIYLTEQKLGRPLRDTEVAILEKAVAVYFAERTVQ